jgi:hypothetical protein
MRVLHLTLKKKWFDMIASGEKKEEYRDYKEYWRRRLLIRGEAVDDMRLFHIVEFRNGYQKNAPKMRLKCLDIYPGEGKPEWGATPGEFYFVIKLGERLTSTELIEKHGN